MRMKLAALARFPIYPLLLGAYPVLYLWMVNAADIPLQAVPRTLLISLTFVIAAFGLALAALRSLRKAALLSAIFLALFYSYGHLFRLVDGASLFGVIVGRHRLLLPLYALVFAGAALLVWRSRASLANLTRSLNAVTAGLVALVLLQAGFGTLQTAAAARSVPKMAAATPVPTQPAAAAPSARAPVGRAPATANVRRDVYYIVVDGYSRSDLLKSEFNLDNQAFIDQLKALGFVVPGCAQSNYGNTILSMASTLNMDYLHDLGYSYKDLVKEDTEATLAPLVKNSLVAQKFKEAGYQFVTFKSLYGFIDMPNSDVYYDFEKSSRPSQTLEALNFQYLFMRTTLLRVPMEWQESNREKLGSLPPGLLKLVSPRDEMFQTRNYKQYEQNLYAFESLANIPSLPGRKFVYAHLFSTHQPFTFTPSGGFRTTFFDSDEGYRDQVVATNTLILQAIRAILANSSVPPVIILQADHSFSSNPADRFKILNAYYLPRARTQLVYPTITPVNTFRLVFTQYFREQMPLLDDVSYLVDKEYPGGYQPAPASCLPGSTAGK